MASTSGFRFFPARSLSAHGHFSQARNAFYQAQSRGEVCSQFFRSWASPYPSTTDLTAGVNPVPDQRLPPFQPPAALPAEAIDWFTIANASTKNEIVQAQQFLEIYLNITEASVFDNSYSTQLLHLPSIFSENGSR